MATTEAAREAALDALRESFDGLLGEHKHFLAAEGVVELDPCNDDAWENVDWVKLATLVADEEA